MMKVFINTGCACLAVGYARAPGVDVRRHFGDRAMFSRRPRVPQDYALLVPGRDRSSSEP